MSLKDDAQEFVDLLTEALIAATVDPRKAASHGRPIVLVTPPAVDYSQRLATWSLVVTKGPALADLDTFEELDALAAQVVEALPIEAARPSSYQLVGDQPPVPAYLLTVTTSV